MEFIVQLISSTTEKKWLVYVDRWKIFSKQQRTGYVRRTYPGGTSNKMDGVRESAWKNLVLGRTMYS